MFLVILIVVRETREPLSHGGFLPDPNSNNDAYHQIIIKYFRAYLIILFPITNAKIYKGIVNQKGIFFVST